MQPLQNEVRLKPGEQERAVREALFWELAEEMYVDPAVERRTMMGFSVCASRASSLQVWRKTPGS